MSNPTNVEVLFRYRSSKNYNVDAFCSDSINGSSYSTFDNCGELNYIVPKSFCARRKLSKQEKERFENVMIKNCKDNYYMACFTRNNPFESFDMWKDYAECGGFCILYSRNELVESVRIAFKEGKSVELKDVNYNSNPYSLAPILDSMFDAYKEAKDEEGNLEENYSKKISEMALINNNGSYVINAFVHKKRDYIKENEVRLIMQKKGHCYTHIDNMITIRPFCVVVSKNMDIISSYRVRKHSMEIGIPCICIDLKEAFGVKLD